MRWGIMIISCVFIAGCSLKKPIDLLIYNTTIYTVDSNFSTSEAMAIDQGRVLATGTTKDLQGKYQARESIDAGGKFVFPGLMDAHSHFMGYALSLHKVNLVGTQSWDECLERVQAFSKKFPEGWITGRGWDQNDWSEKAFPENTKLNQLFPDRPVVLTRIDGHAVIANEKALSLAGIKAGDHIDGGEIKVEKGRLTGVLVDNATDLIYSKIPALSVSKVANALREAQLNCFAVGLTSVSDCGLDYSDVLLMDSLQRADVLQMRVFAMLSDKKANYDYLFKKGEIKTDYLTVNAFKLYADGALGSRGACLIHPYTDRPGWTGFLLSSAAHFDSMARQIYAHGFQMCTHAIGDSANRVLLQTYARYLKGKNDRRWRIEHAQVIDPADFHFFGDYNIVPSVQPTHATSDMYWAQDRLGAERVHHAYANHELLEQNGWIPLGTDFPVEDISPIKTFYAAVFRQDAKDWPTGGFQRENALSREDALKGMTIWAAKAQFEENKKGSLEKGKLADFIVSDTDLMHAPQDQILKTKILITYSGGRKVYELKK